MSVYEFNEGTSRKDRARAILCGAFCLVCLLFFQPQASAAQASSSTSEGPVAVGRLSGDDVSVKGAISFETENGRTTALLASGSDLTLRSGEAKVDLPEGGEIILCGPAHLSILKAGAAITIALDYGQLHLQISGAEQVTVYSPLLIVTPVPIGTRQTDLTVGLDQKGVLCVMALSGAMRIEEQLTGENLVVPQGGDVQIEGGELRTLHNGARTCSCELLVSQNNPRQQTDSSTPARSLPNGSSEARAPKSIDSPTYRIEVPLAFDASSATTSAGLTLQAVQLIRESVVEQPISFRGAITPALPAPPSEIPTPIRRSHNSKFGFFARFFGIFHHHKPPASESAEVQP
jgi:hypothetical protein